MKCIYTFVASVMLLCSCKSMVTFETPNSLRNMPATVYMENGKTYDGKLIIQNHDFVGTKIKLYQEGDDKPMNFYLSEVKGYTLNGAYYELKEVRNNPLIRNGFFFMKRLTAEKSRIHLYESKERVPSSGKPYHAGHTPYETRYYVQLPGEQNNVVWPLNSSRLVPHFNEKMSKLVADCPELAKKIEDKDSDHFYHQVSLSKERRVHVLLQIIHEYNQCK